MRRAVMAVAVAALIGSATPATAAPIRAEPTPSASPATDADRGAEVCSIKDERLIEVSGMAATARGFVVVNDGTDVLSRGKVFTLDSSCRVGKQVGSYPAPGQRDPEDLAIGTDGSIWIADIGDDPLNPRRPNIALWKFPADLIGKPTLYRLRYPDGAHDAEALLLGPGDIPIIVTKNVGAAGIYVPTGPLTPSTSANQAGAMSRVGEFTPERTSTDNPSGLLGKIVITGGANSPDRQRAVLRTYADAYEWDVPDGDVVKAITTSKPRITPLPAEPQGEAITYSADGASFLTVSETADLPGDQLPTILRYTRSTGVKPLAAGGAGVPVRRNSLSWYERISLTQATSLIAGVGVVGVLLVLAGVIGIMRTRSRTAPRSGKGGTSADSADGGVSEDSQPTAVLTAVREAYADDYSGYPASGYSAGDYPQAGYPQAGYPQAGYPADQYDGYGDPHGYGTGHPPGR